MCEMMVNSMGFSGEDYHNGGPIIGGPWNHPWLMYGIVVVDYHS